MLEVLVNILIIAAIIAAVLFLRWLVLQSSPEDIFWDRRGRKG